MNLSRRQMLTGTSAGLVAAALGAVTADPARAVIRGATSRDGSPTAGAEPAPGARSYDFGPDWKFALVTAAGVTDPTGAYADAYQPGFDDSGWRVVDAPHDWSIELSPVEASYTESFNGFLPGGLAWYRKTFTLPSWMAGKKISVEFDGVYMNSNVYLNGQFLGNHPYAYTGFNYDLTPVVHADGKTPNVIAVQASNQIPSSRWYSGSGIYRNVHIVVTDPVHIARHGTFVTTPGAAATVPAWLRERPSPNRYPERERRGCTGHARPAGAGRGRRRRGERLCHAQRERRRDADGDHRAPHRPPVAVVGR